MKTVETREENKIRKKLNRRNFRNAAGSPRRYFAKDLHICIDMGGENVGAQSKRRGPLKIRFSPFLFVFRQYLANLFKPFYKNRQILIG